MAKYTVNLSPVAEVVLNHTHAHTHTYTHTKYTHMLQGGYELVTTLTMDQVIKNEVDRIFKLVAAWYCISNVN